MCYDSEPTICQYRPIKHAVNMSYYTHFFINKLKKMSQKISFLGEPLNFRYH